MTALTGIFGGFLSACMDASALSWGGWATILVWLEFLMGEVHCETNAYFRRSLAGLAPGGGCGCFGKKRREVIAASRSPGRNQVGAAADYTIAARNVVRPLVFAMIAWTVAFTS
jgi:hypothetical protein